MSEKDEQGNSQKPEHDKIQISSKPKEDKSDGIIEKSPKKRRSSVRRNNAKFFGICFSCFQYLESTVGEVAGFAYEHMCECASAQNVDELEKAIKILEDKRAFLTVSQPPPSDSKDS